MSRRKQQEFPSTIWTTLHDIGDCDLVRNRNLYTMPEDKWRVWPKLPQDIIEVDVEKVSATGTFAWVQSPEGFGPPHLIKLHAPYHFAFSKVAWLLEMMDRYTYPVWNLHYVHAKLSGHDRNLCIWDSPENYKLPDLFKAYNKAADAMKRIRVFLEAIEREVKGES